METGTYLLLLSKPDNYLMDNVKVMGSAPCGVYYTREEADAAKVRMERETIYNVTVVQIVS